MSKQQSKQASCMAGEFFVMHALYRLGLEPALTLGNAKSTDIFVRTPKGTLLQISVKSVRGGGKWPVGDNTDTRADRLFFACVLFSNFEDPMESPDVYVIPSEDVEKLREPWLKGYAVYFSNEDRREQLKAYRNNWHPITTP